MKDRVRRSNLWLEFQGEKKAKMGQRSFFFFYMTELFKITSPQVQGQQFSSWATKRHLQSNVLSLVMGGDSLVSVDQEFRSGLAEYF